MRHGKYTSSAIYKLMGSDKVRTTYIQEKKFEQKLGISLSTDTNAKSLTWGLLMEKYVAKYYLKQGYNLNSDVVIQSPDYPYWCGTPDGDCGHIVFDIKNPFTRLSFCQQIEIIKSGDLELFEKNKPEYFWQLVSNSILTGIDTAELIVFMPKLSELQNIRDFASNLDDERLESRLFWIANSLDSDLPYLPEDCEYESYNSFKFEVPQDAKDRLKANLTKYPL